MCDLSTNWHYVTNNRHPTDVLLIRILLALQISNVVPSESVGLLYPKVMGCMGGGGLALEIAYLSRPQAEILVLPVCRPPSGISGLPL